MQIPILYQDKQIKNAVHHMKHGMHAFLEDADDWEFSDVINKHVSQLENACLTTIRVIKTKIVEDLQEINTFCKGYIQEM